MEGGEQLFPQRCRDWRADRVGEYITEDINKTKRKVTKDLSHHPVEGVPSVPDFERKAKELEHTKQCNDCCFLDVIFTYGPLIITCVQI